MSIDALWVLVPLKNLDRAKERLAGVLDPHERRELVGAMARDVLDALLGVPLAAGQIVLVSDDAEVAALAHEFGTGILRPRPLMQDPLNAALTEATDHVLRCGARHVLVLHADLPCATSAELRALIARHQARLADDRGAHATLVSDRAGSGTNCLLSSPPAAFPYRFGAGSRRLHHEAGAAAGVALAEFDADGLRRDIDEPTELAELVAALQSLQNGCGAHTARLLQRLRPPSSPNRG